MWALFRPTLCRSLFQGENEQAVNTSFSELQEMEWQYENVSYKLENYANFGNVHLSKDSIYLPTLQAL